jgi:predicted O-methyltransferase YrrM
MARALPPGGRLRTIEISDAHADFAEQWVRRSDVADRIEVLRGDARRILPRFETASADAAFIDADKEGYSLYLHECLRIVRSGGLLLLDNAFANGHLLDSSSKEPMAPIVRDFNDYMAGIRELQSIIVPLGDGCWMAIKR